MKKKVFIPFEQIDAHGDVFSKDCKFNFAPGIKILESHRSKDGLTIITDMKIDEASMIPKIFGFNVF